ncbi:hypothetical protein [Paludibaculum fermentans]|uniref:hypothetical protein n=1 Tax=Paludibaculum fermentans TaxID=1473598 RepID=UPI003EBD7A76
MQPKLAALVPLLAVGVGAVAYFLVSWKLIDKDALYVAASVSTFLIVGWYTWETNQLRKATQRQLETSMMQLAESQRQTEVAQRPILTLEVVSIDFGGTSIESVGLCNLGDGPAFNISSSVLKIGNAEVTFDARSFVRANDKAQIFALWSPAAGGGPTKLWWQELQRELRKAGQRGRSELELTYESVDQTRYRTFCTMCSEATEMMPFKFTRQEKV